MFGLGKKKKKTVQKTVEVKASVQETPAMMNKEELLSQADELEKALPGKQREERIDTLNALGSLYFKAQEYDKAIERYETSLAEDPKLGIAHKDLMKLYSVKKKQAAEEKDTDKVMYYVNKMEELTGISKQSMRSGNF